MSSLTPAVPSPMRALAASQVAQNASPRRGKCKLIVLSVGIGIVVLIVIVLLSLKVSIIFGILVTVLVVAAIGVRLGLFFREPKSWRPNGSVLALTVPPHRLRDNPSSTRPQQYLRSIAPPPTDNGVAIQMPPETASNTQLSPGSANPLPSIAPGISFFYKKSTFAYEELVTATDGFSSANFLGQGGFGSVHRGVLPNGKCVAVKQLKPGSTQGEREFRTEVEIISLIHHRHLVSLVGYCISGAQRMLVYEFVPNNTLKFHLHGKERPTMSWETRMKIALGSAKGLAYLHEDCEPKIIHRDIKADNILLDYNFVAKVADFGLAKFLPDDHTHVSTLVKGTFGYLDPEYASSEKLTDKSDVYSFGVVLLELITGRRPIYTTQSSERENLVVWARPLLKQAQEGGNFDTLVDPRLQDYNSSEMARMVACAAACVHSSASLRPQMSQILRALVGNIPLDDLNEGIKPGDSTIYIEDLNFNMMA